MLNKYKNKIRTLFLAAILPLLAASGWANAGEDNVQYSPSASGVSAYVDKNIDGLISFPIKTSGDDIEYVHLWFKQMMGAFIFAPWSQMDKDPNKVYNGDDVTLLAKALGFTNVLAIIICLVVTYYMIIGGAINTAAEGQVLGKSWNTPWLMLRTAVGFTLITPMTIIGGMTLSLAQVGVIWLLIIGSNAASVLWYYTVDQLRDGTHIVSPSIELGRHKTADILKMVMCADASVRVRSAGAYTVTRPSSKYDYGKGNIVKDNTTGATYNGDLSAIIGQVIGVHYIGEMKEITEDDGTRKGIIDKKQHIYLGEKMKSNGSEFFVLGDQKIEANAGERIRKITFGYDSQCGEIAFDNGIAKPEVGYGAAFKEDGNLGDTVQALDYKSAAMMSGRQAYALKIIDIINHLIASNQELMKTRTYSKGMFGTSSQNALPRTDRIGYLDMSKFMTSTGLRNCLASEESGCGDEMDDYYYSKFKAAQKHFNYAAKIYADDIVDSVHTATVAPGGDDDLINQLYEKMERGGWPAAGIWFFEISALPGMSYNVINGVHKNIKPEAVSFCFQSTKLSENNCNAMENEANAGYKIADLILAESLRLSDDDEAGVANELDAAHAPCSALGSCSAAAASSDRLSISISKEVLEFLSNSPLNANPLATGTSDAENRLSSPFLFAAELGHTMNYVAQNTVTAAILGFSIRDYIEGFDSPSNQSLFDQLKSISGVEKALHLFFGLPKAIAMNTLSFGSGLLIMIAMAAFSSGFMLAYVIPFMPVMTWIMMMAGYMLTAVEAVAAAPLAIVLLFTPEGQGISGSRFERALQLVAMAILRPSFMVIGMIAGLTVSFVAFTMMNIFFFTAAEYLLSGTVFDLFAVIILYVSATYQLCQLMVETMYTLPDRIGEWFAGGVSRQFGESRIAGSAENSMSTLSSQMQQLPQQILKMQQGKAEDAVSNERRS